MVMRAATAVWEGELFTGKGTVALDSSSAAGPLDVNWPARAENPNGVTSPEELIAAAHATCYAMSLANGLAKAGTPAERLEATAQVHIEKGDAGFSITRSELKVRGTGSFDEAAFRAAAETAKAGCPVSRALADSIEITLDAGLA
ncbi:MAG TPA: OsmC family peroxiredoxin [Mycobacteriales bacterium]|jgi:osmotically inducible protein OsmC|nr:OsmC family peroxiredoxin [Mycobacteriales bacterium]